VTSSDKPSYHDDGASVDSTGDSTDAVSMRFSLPLDASGEAVSVDAEVSVLTLSSLILI